MDVASASSFKKLILAAGPAETGTLQINCNLDNCIVQGSDPGPDPLVLRFFRELT
jgi:hypothetical protein